MDNIIDFHFIGGDRRMALKALSRFYPEYSAKRRMLKRLNMLNQAGCRLVPNSFSRLAAAERFMPEIGKTQTRAVMLHKINQSNRAYFFDHHTDGHLLAVTKLALTEAAAKGIRREAETLRAIAGRTAFQTPDVLAFQSWQGGCLLQVSAVPECHTRHDKARPLPEALFQAVAALRPSDAPAMLPAAAFGGWQEMRSRVTEPTIRAVAILSLTLHDVNRVWKGIDWEITDRLHAKGLIHDPSGKAKSLTLTDEGLARAGDALAAMFAKRRPEQAE